MSEAPRSWTIIGAGTVGGALADMVAKPRVAAEFGLERQPVAVLRRDGWHEQGKDGPLLDTASLDLPDSEVLFVAASPTPDSEPTLTLMRKQLALGRTVITAEKRSLAYNLAEFKQAEDRFGYWATVGGGTRLLPTLARFWATDPANVREMIIAPNATLTFVYGEVAAGREPAEVVQQARQEGLAEPDAAGVYEVIHNEAANDVPSKTAIALGTIFPYMKELSPDAFRTRLTKNNVTSSLKIADKLRYLVAIFREEDADRAHRMTRGRIGGFEPIVHEGLLIIGGLLRIDVNPKYNALGRFKDTSGPEAGYYIELGPPVDGRSATEKKIDSDGHNFSMGTGAGGLTTATAMLDNYQAIRNRRA